MSLFGRIGSTSMSIGGPTDGFLGVRLRPLDERERSTDEIMRAARIALSEIPGQEFAVIDPMGMNDRDFEVEILGNVSLEELDHYSDLLMSRLEADGGLVDLDKTLRVGLP